MDETKFKIIAVIILVVFAIIFFGYVGSYKKDNTTKSVISKITTPITTVLSAITTPITTAVSTITTPITTLFTGKVSGRYVRYWAGGHSLNLRNIRLFDTNGRIPRETLGVSASSVQDGGMTINDLQDSNETYPVTEGFVRPLLTSNLVKNGIDEWIEFDLGSTKDLSTIKIYQADDWRGDRMWLSYIEVFDSSRNSVYKSPYVQSTEPVFTLDIKNNSWTGSKN